MNPQWDEGMKAYAWDLRHLAVAAIAIYDKNTFKKFSVLKADDLEN